MSNDNTKLGVIALAALVVSAMIGGGIFSLPQNMAQSASSAAVIVSWIITGIGIFFLANTFRILADARPDATTGIYAYARLGFGKFAGFQMAWSYWLSNIFGNVGYAVLLMDALDYFFPGVFTGGNNLWSIIGGSCVIWLMNFAVLRGVKQAAGVNVIGTICKLIPLAIFILALLFVFRWTVFADSFSYTAAKGAAKLGSFPEQIKSTMLVTLWAFIGIEGAVVVSNRARSQRDVGKATLLGFLCCLSIYVLISVLPFGRMSQHQLAGLSNPSTAPILQDAVHGHWGGVLMNLGVIIALLTSWLAFTIMIAQIP
jgi:arginine:ornithine antiporter/lysine permease